jgi:peroxiredoxin
MNNDCPKIVGVLKIHTYSTVEADSMNPNQEAAEQQRSISKPRISQGARDRASKIIQTLILCLGLGVLAQNIILQRQNKDIKQAQSKMMPIDQCTLSLTSQITKGRSMHQVSGATLGAEFREINLVSKSSRGSVIMTFSPTCPHCIQNQEGWGILAAQLKSAGWRVVWVSRDPLDMTRKYCKAHGIDSSDVIADPTSRTHDQLDLGVVPFTMVVDADGTIQQVWGGELRQSWQSVFAYFQLNAPSSLLAVQSAQN